jgi:hypothetical protein
MKYVKNSYIITMNEFSEWNFHTHTNERVTRIVKKKRANGKSYGRTGKQSVLFFCLSIIYVHAREEK